MNRICEHEEKKGMAQTFGPKKLAHSGTKARHIQAHSGTFGHILTFYEVNVCSKIEKTAPGEAHSTQPPQSYIILKGNMYGAGR